MLLPNPVIEDAVNPSAARIFASSPSGFRQTVLDCVLASKRVEGEKKFTKVGVLLLAHTRTVLQNSSQIASNLTIHRKSFYEKCTISTKWQRKKLFCYSCIQIIHVISLRTAQLERGGRGGEGRGAQTQNIFLAQHTTYRLIKTIFKKERRVQKV